MTDTVERVIAYSEIDDAGLTDDAMATFRLLSDKRRLPFDDVRYEPSCGLGDPDHHPCRKCGPAFFAASWGVNPWQHRRSRSTAIRTFKTLTLSEWSGC